METAASAAPLATTRRVRLALAALVTVGAVLRVRGGWNDLWLDEIWSLEVARDVHAPLDVFTRLHHEINHYGTTLWLWAAGSRGNWFGYRVPSLVLGIATIPLAAAIARRRGPAAMVFTTAAVAFSYLLILYASEVRGYAGLVFFSFLAFLLLDAYLRRGDAWIGLAFALCALLGLVAHLAFASVLLAALVACGWALAVRATPLPVAAGRLALCFGLPIAALAVLYRVDLREIVEGGGGTATGSLIADYGTALAWTLGAPMSPAAQLVGCVLAIGVLDAGLRRVARDDRVAAVFLGGAILVFPLLLAIARASPVVYPRHFLVSIAFLTLLVGVALAALWERGGAARWAAAALLAAYVAANGAHVRTLFANGRGENGAALRFVLDQSPAGPVTIGADDDFRIERVVHFYDALGDAGRIVYQPRGTWQGAGPAWLIVNRDSYERPNPRGDQIRDEAGRRFDFVRAFPAAPLAGLHWFVYRNADR
jgi:hypothetical protein